MHVFVFVAQAGVKCAALYSGAHAHMRHAQIHLHFSKGRSEENAALMGQHFHARRCFTRVPACRVVPGTVQLQRCVGAVVGWVYQDQRCLKLPCHCAFRDLVVAERFPRTNRCPDRPMIHRIEPHLQAPSFAFLLVAKPVRHYA